MTDDEIKKYYGTLDLQQLKLVALNRQIYPWRKIPMYMGEDAAYAAQNINARNLIIGNGESLIEFSIFGGLEPYTLNPDINRTLVGKPSFSGLKGGIAQTNRTWIDPDMDLPSAGWHEIDRERRDSVEKYLNRNGYFLSGQEERPSGFLSRTRIPSKDDVAWINKSFEKMTTCLINEKWNDGNVSGKIGLVCNLHYSGEILNGTVINPDEVGDYDYIYMWEDHYRNEHIGSTEEYSRVPYLDRTKLLVDGHVYDRLDLKIEDGEKYHGDWIDWVKICIILHGTFNEYNYSDGPFLTQHIKSFLLVLDRPYITAKDIVDAFAYIKASLNYTTDVTDGENEIYMLIDDVRAIVTIKKDDLMIQGD